MISLTNFPPAISYSSQPKRRRMFLDLLTGSLPYGDQRISISSLLHDPVPHPILRPYVAAFNLRPIPVGDPIPGDSWGASRNTSFNLTQICRPIPPIFAPALEAEWAIDPGDSDVLFDDERFFIPLLHAIPLVASGLFTWNQALRLSEYMNDSLWIPNDFSGGSDFITRLYVGWQVPPLPANNGRVLPGALINSISLASNSVILANGYQGAPTADVIPYPATIARTSQNAGHYLPGEITEQPQIFSMIWNSTPYVPPPSKGIYFTEFDFPLT